MRRRRFAGYNPAVTHVAAAKQLGVRIQDLFVEPFLGHAEAVSHTRYWREVAANEHKAPVLRPANEGDRRVVSVVKVDPFKSGVMEIDLVKRGYRPIQSVQFFDK